MSQCSKAHEPQLLSLHTWSLCSATREAIAMRSPGTATKGSPHSLQLAKACRQQWRPSRAKKWKSPWLLRQLFRVHWEHKRQNCEWGDWTSPKEDFSEEMMPVLSQERWICVRASGLREAECPQYHGKSRLIHLSDICWVFIMCQALG